MIPGLHTNNAFTFKNNLVFNTSAKENKKVFTPESNWAFIDMQNLYQGVKDGGWKIDWVPFRNYLSVQLNVTKALAFLGYIKEFEYLYRKLRNAGFTLEFREVKQLSNGVIDGGNVDADLASYVMDYKTEYHRAVIVADDGDYCRTIQSLNRQNKLKLILSSHTFRNTSQLIKQAVDNRLILSIHNIKNLIGQKII